MVTKLKEVDAVIVGLGWTGGILAKELNRVLERRGEGVGLTALLGGMPVAVLVPDNG